MRTEAKKSFNHGFLLTEAEIRRLATDIHDQLARNSPGPIVSSFELRFRNGTIAHPSSIDEVLCESNIGTILITRLRLSFSIDDIVPPSRFVSIEFANSWHHFSRSVTYTVASDDRDWAFVVTSRIEERIKAIKRGVDLASLLMLAFISIVAGFLVWALYVELPIGDQEIEHFYKDLQLTEIAKLRDEWSSGRLADPVEALLRGLEILIRPAIPDELSQQYKFARSVILLMFFLLIFITVVLIGVEYFFPRYNFYWGDYMHKYNKRVFWGRILYGGVVLALMVGVTASYIASMIPRP